MAERTPLTPPDPSGLEAWIRQVLRLAGPRASTFTPPLPSATSQTAAAEGAAETAEEPRKDGTR